MSSPERALQLQAAVKPRDESDPATPMPELSVAVAQPAKIEPSTITMRKVMGARPCHISRQNSARVCGPKPAGIFGAYCGFSAQHHASMSAVQQALCIEFPTSGRVNYDARANLEEEGK